MYSVFGRGALLSAAFCLCWLLVQSSRQCNFPPSVWCSSREIARACQVEEQCENNAWRVQNNAPKVNLALYYETLCPGCKGFVKSQLWPTFLQVADILNLELVPYGNARETQVGDVWQFTCQHGPMECLGNLIQTCAIHFTGNISKVFPFVACMEMSDLEPNVSAPAMHTDDIQDRAMSNLLKLLCDTYTGPKPDACRCMKALHKCQKDDL